MPVRDCRDDVFGAKCRVTTEKHTRNGGLKRVLVQLGQAPLVKLDTTRRLDPGESIFLPHRDQHGIARHQHVRIASWHQTALAFFAVNRLDHFKSHAGEFAVVMLERLGHMEVDDGDALVLRIFLLPWRGLHFIKSAAHNHLHVRSAQAARRAATVHGGITSAQHNDALANGGDVAERNRGEPVNADVDVLGDVSTARDVQVSPARRTTPHKHCVITLLQQC